MKLLFMPLLLFACSIAGAATVTTGTDEQARLPFWQLTTEGLSIRLVQRLPDQTRAFFRTRGFNKQQAEVYALSCVFQTVFKNTSNENTPSPLEYDLKQWKVTANGKSTPPRNRQIWAKQWKAMNVSEQGIIAFYWAQLPTVQKYQPGDYNWGMSSYGLKPGSKFDLTLVWRQYGKQHSHTIKNMQCAPDIHPDPGQL